MGLVFWKMWIVILLFEFAWIGHVLRRHSKDIGELRRSESVAHKAVILTVWLITAGMIAHVCFCVFRLGSALWASFQYSRSML